MPKQVSTIRQARLPNEIPVVIPKIVKQLQDRRAKMLSRQSQKPIPIPKDEEIIPSKIHRWKLKDPNNVVRKIKEISQHQPSSRQYKIDKILELENESEQSRTNSELWEEALKSKEERHFQLGRITNFFS
ncbi:MAG: hypothetical protein JSR58_03480 [Verrucomicrobia bacterium]|nr:hypothetical protein [Verrucomicrobiota bacterium]